MTMLKSFCKMPNLRKITRPFAAAALAALARALAPVFSRFCAAFADNAPDWLRAAAHQTLPDYPRTPSPSSCSTNYKPPSRIMAISKPGIATPTSFSAPKLVKTTGTRSSSSTTKRKFPSSGLDDHCRWQGNGTEGKRGVGSQPRPASKFSATSAPRSSAFPQPMPAAWSAIEYVQKHRPFVFEDDW